MSTQPGSTDAAAEWDRRDVADVGQRHVAELLDTYLVLLRKSRVDGVVEQRLDENGTTTIFTFTSRADA